MEEEKVEKFTIFKNTYKLLRHLPEKNKTELYDAMFDYMFEGIEPSFNDELSDGIWVNLKMILDNTKSRILNGKKGGRNSGTNELGYENQEPNPEPNMEPNHKPNYEPKVEANNKANPQANTVFLISNFFISNFNYLDISNKEKLKNKILEWNQYKIEKKKKYTETGITNLLKQIDKYTEKYGVEIMIDLIDECMANNYQGIIFDKLKDRRYQQKSISEKNAEVLAKERERIRKEKELNEQRGSS